MHEHSDALHTLDGVHGPASTADAQGPTVVVLPTMKHLSALCTSARKACILTFCRMTSSDASVLTQDCKHSKPAHIMPLNTWNQIRILVDC